MSDPVNQQSTIALFLICEILWISGSSWKWTVRLEPTVSVDLGSGVSFFGVWKKGFMVDLCKSKRVFFSSFSELSVMTGDLSTKSEKPAQSQSRAETLLSPLPKCGLNVA
jgi:hypothetical protein